MLENDFSKGLGVNLCLFINIMAHTVFQRTEDNSVVYYLSILPMDWPIRVVMSTSGLRSMGASSLDPTDSTWLFRSRAA